MNEDKAWLDYSDHFRTEVLPKLLDSAIFLSIGTNIGDFDVQQATELGAAIICDKPVLLVVPVGRRISEKLRKLADVVIDDWKPENLDSQERIAQAIKRLVKE